MFAWLMGLPTITPEDLNRLLRAGQAMAIDVNAPGSWTQAHVPGALNFDPQAFGSADLPQDRGALLVFYCSNPLCRKAPNAALRARKLGYENVRVMSAGIKGWLSARLPVESGAPAARPR
ncbi:MAG TPA: rhodanese-like domain-containing protein [Thermoanaerobaculia bacterium]|nr:rhodanese-like domain-containing protein [Thermoanaerobaculia bacterium]